jgi:hypothetical protein
VSPGSGIVEDLNSTQVTAMLNQFTDSLKGMVPPSGGGNVNFLCADGSFKVPYTPTQLQVVDSVPASTSSSTYVALGSCQITPSQAGDYLVQFVTEVQSIIAGNEAAFAIFVNGIQQTIGTEKTIKLTTSNAKQELTLISKVTYTTGVIEIRFRRASGMAGNIASSSRVLIVSK